jgi:hypothetical protein
MRAEQCVEHCGSHTTGGRPTNFAASQKEDSPFSYAFAIAPNDTLAHFAFGIFD